MRILLSILFFLALLEVKGQNVCLCELKANFRNKVNSFFNINSNICFLSDSTLIIDRKDIYFISNGNLFKNVENRLFPVFHKDSFEKGTTTYFVSVFDDRYDETKMKVRFDCFLPYKKGMLPTDTNFLYFTFLKLATVNRTNDCERLVSSITSELFNEAVFEEESVGFYLYVPGKIATDINDSELSQFELQYFFESDSCKKYFLKNSLILWEY